MTRPAITNNHTFLIIGANSDIAKATALKYLQKYPYGHLLLASRNTNQLNDFVKSIYSKTGKYGNVVAVSAHYDHQIVENDDGNYYVDGVLVEAKLHNLEEVKQYIGLQQSANETRIKLYEDISDTRIAGIIKKHYNTKITKWKSKDLKNTLILTNTKSLKL